MPNFLSRKYTYQATPNGVSRTPLVQQVRFARQIMAARRPGGQFVHPHRVCTAGNHCQFCSAYVYC